MLWLACLSVAEAAPDFMPLQVLPDGERAKSEKDAYVYLFIEVGSSADNCSLYQIDCEQSAIACYRSRELLGLVDWAKGACMAATEKNGSVAFIVVNGKSSRLRLRIPLSVPLESSSKLGLNLYFFQSATVQGRYFLGTGPDFQQAVEIFVREPARDIQPRVRAQIVLDGESLSKFINGTLEPQKGVLSSY